MERALNLTLLRAALGADDYTLLPTPEELQRLLGDAETRLFMGNNVVPDDLLTTGWYLHAVASADRGLERYSVIRQRQAFAVSAHILDLALRHPDLPRRDRLQLGFGAAIGYRRGDQEPNATAIVRRLAQDIDLTRPIAFAPDTLALEAALVFLSFDRRRLSPALRRWRRELRQIATAFEPGGSLAGTMFGPTEAVLGAIADLLAYLTRGSEPRRERALQLLRAVALGELGAADHLTRWVAAHLLSFGGEAVAGSLFELLPPYLPAAVAHAFTLASSPVLTLWEPQRDLLRSGRNPLDAATRRMVLSLPTSAGKTLMAQLVSVAHLSQTTTGVCYVAPTRTLCHEVRRALAERLRTLEREVADEVPDLHLIDALLRQSDHDPSDPLGQLAALFVLLEQSSLGTGDVQVVTPEQLLHQLRADSSKILTKFGLFIIDEAQLMQEPSRGFTVEALIAQLSGLTRDSDHRLVLLSAAMGNAAQVLEWVDPDATGVLYESTWRGPRRLHALLSSSPDWDQKVITRRPTKQRYPYRHTFPMIPRVDLRLSDSRIETLRTTEPVGQLVLKALSPEQTVGRETDSTSSSTKSAIGAQIIATIGHAGSVLVVAGTRKSAERMARELAKAGADLPVYEPLVEFVREQLSADHPLVGYLQQGVGYHHAGLPREVLEAIEDALRQGTLTYLTCTSTLTEGINLPVHTVVLYDEDYAPNGRLQGGRLVNAMGRAGRAGQESEGWIILLQTGDPKVSRGLRDLHPSPDELAVDSALLEEGHLAALAAAEEATRDAEDGVVAIAASQAADFISFVWGYLAGLESLGRLEDETNGKDIADFTLAARQSPQVRQVIVQLAERTRRTYLGTETATRRRWARSGGSLPIARSLDQIADDIVDRVLQLDTDDTIELYGPYQCLDFLEELNVPSRLLHLSTDRRPWRFRVSVKGVDVPVSVSDVLRGWLNGRSYAELAQELLLAIPEPSWRISQLVDNITTHIQDWLAWTLGAVLTEANERLAAAGVEGLDARGVLCPQLSGFVRYGVEDPLALFLLLSGVRSRRLATTIAEQSPTTDTSELLEWLRHISISAARIQFAATPSQLSDLLSVSRRRGRSPLRQLLDEQSTTLGVVVVADGFTVQRPEGGDFLTVEVTETGITSPSPLGVYINNRQIAEVANEDWTDAQAIISTGLAMNYSLEPAPDGSLRLRIGLAAEDDVNE